MAAVSGVAFAMLRNLLRSYGLDELSSWAYDRFVEGKSSDEIMIEIESQPAFKQKFSAIFDRRAKGLPPVSVDELVEYKRNTLNLEHFYDLPPGMLSDDKHVNALVAGDTSFDELTKRVQRGAYLMYQQPKEVRDFLQNQYGIGEGGLIAFYTDPNHAEPYLEQIAQGAIVAGQAQASGYGALTRQEAEQLAQAGVTQDQAASAFGELTTGKELLDPLAGTGETAIDRQAQLGVVEGHAGDIATLQRRARQRAAVTQEGGKFAGKGLVTGTDR